MNEDQIPPRFIFAADQGYAQAQARLNELVSELVADMQKRPSRDDAAPWATSVLLMMNSQDRWEGKVPPALIEVWQAAVYRLARQHIVAQSHG